MGALSNAAIHNTKTLTYLHWLPLLPASSSNRTADLTFKTLTTHQPSYIHDLLQSHCSSRQLRSASHNLLEIPGREPVSLNAVSPTVLHASGTVYLTSSLATWTSLQTLSKRNSKRFITLLLPVDPRDPHACDSSSL